MNLDLELEGQVPINKILSIIVQPKLCFQSHSFYQRTVFHMESDHSHHTTFIPYWVLHNLAPTYLPNDSPAPLCVHHSCHSGLLLPYEHVEHTPSQGLGICPSLFCRAIWLPLHFLLYSNVTSWERPLLMGQSKTTFHSLLHLLFLFRCSSKHLL